MALLVYFTLLFLIAFPLGEMSRIPLSLTVSVSLLDIFVVFGGLAWLFYQVYKRQTHFTGIEKLFIATAGIFGVSLIFNVFHLTLAQTIISDLYNIRWFCYGLLLFIASRIDAKNKKYIHTLLIVSGVIALFGGYAQYFFYPSLRNLIYFGWDEHFYRMFGTFFDPNFFGLFLSLFFIFTVSFLFRITPNKQKYLFVGLFLLSSATFVGIILTYSRTALVALFAGLIILLWHKSLRKWLVFFAFAAVILVGSTFFLIQQKAFGNNLFRTNSTGARIGSAKDALTIFMDSPIIGVGFNSYRYSMYAHHFQTGSTVQEDHGASGADSSILLVLATSGVVGCSVFLTFFVALGKQLWKKQRKVGLATLVAFFVGSFFVNGLFYPLLLVWVWTVVGLTMADDEQ